MFSILYSDFGEIFKIGPFETEDLAMEAAKEANKKGTFSIEDQYVYLLDSDQHLSSICASDLE